MNGEAEPVTGTGIRIIPPVYMLLLALAGFTLNGLLPWTVVPTVGWCWFGVVLCTIAGSLYLWTVLTLKKAGTPLDARKSARVLVLQGPFRFSRNPLYLAALVLFAGLGLAWNTVWLWLAGIVFQQILQHRVIPAEERDLQRSFGVHYAVYVQQVRRWL